MNRLRILKAKPHFTKSSFILHPRADQNAACEYCYRVLIILYPFPIIPLFMWESPFEDLALSARGNSFVCGRLQDKESVKQSTLQYISHPKDRSSKDHRTPTSVSSCLLVSSLISQSADTICSRIVASISFKTRSSFIASNKSFVDCSRRVSAQQLDRINRKDDLSLSHTQ